MPIDCWTISTLREFTLMAKFDKFPDKCRIPKEKVDIKLNAAKSKLLGTHRIVVENHKDIEGLEKFALENGWKGILALEDDNRNRGRLRGHLRGVAKKIGGKVKFIKF